MSAEKQMTLRDIETTLQALESIEADEIELTPELEAEYRREIQATLAAAPEKRDHVGWFITHLMAQAELAKKVEAKAKRRAAAYERAALRVSEYVLDVIKELGQSKDGKWKKLEGKEWVLKAVKCPVSTEIVDIEQVPLEYQRVTVVMSALDWVLIFYDVCQRCGGKGYVNSIVLNYGVDNKPIYPKCMKCGGTGKVDAPTLSMMEKHSFEVMKSKVKAAIEKGVEVPGARLVKDKLRLEVE
jgi:hypothetical protein